MSPKKNFGGEQDHTSNQRFVNLSDFSNSSTGYKCVHENAGTADAVKRFEKSLGKSSTIENAHDRFLNILDPKISWTTFRFAEKPGSRTAKFLEMRMLHS